jgi:hypothetical protein
MAVGQQCGLPATILPDIPGSSSPAPLGMEAMGRATSARSMRRTSYLQDFGSRLVRHQSIRIVSTAAGGLGRPQR